METIDDQYLEIFKAIVHVLEKLELLPNKEGARILHLFLKDFQNRNMLINLYEKLIDVLLCVSKEMLQCAMKDMLLP